jgi:hypothetical protein
MLRIFYGFNPYVISLRFVSGLRFVYSGCAFMLGRSLIDLGIDSNRRRGRGQGNCQQG